MEDVKPYKILAGKHNENFVIFLLSKMVASKIQATFLSPEKFPEYLWG